MITVNEAFSILEKQYYSKQIVEVSLQDAHNHILAETIFSPIDMPPFRQATMDGFALCLDETLEYTIIGEIKAGDFFEGNLNRGEAIKIFTGALVPDDANAVIQIEKVTVENTKLLLQETVAIGTNIRQKGTQITKNEIALSEDTFLNSASIGFLAGLGIASVKVFQKPSIGIVVTGNELIALGNELPIGKVYDSNSIMLQTALAEKGFNKSTFYYAKDTFQATQEILSKAIEENDVVLVSGGISVGDYDFVGKALEKLNVETLFYKVNQKPGKPLLAGKKSDKFIFALPGNPAASLTCFYVYVLPVLKRVSGQMAQFGSVETKTIAHDYVVNNPRAQFLKALFVDNKVSILTHQDSAMLNTFAKANALVFVAEGSYTIEKETLVKTYLLN
jgi:molybdopterin molybdotransferase